MEDWYKSKTVWGMLGFSVFGILNVFWPSDVLTALVVAALGWAGYGLRDAL